MMYTPNIDSAYKTNIYFSKVYLVLCIDFIYKLEQMLDTTYKK
jgi:hypothetical protein